MLKDRMVALAGIFGKRYSKKQKIRFLRYVQRSAQEKGVKMYLDEGEASGKSGCNVYLGPTQRAKTILAVPYDTPSRLWWPGLHYYPMDPGRNARQESLVMALNFALAAVLLAAYWFAVFRRCFSVGGLTGGLALFGLLLMALLAVNLVLGSANAKNYSRNSASLALALGLSDEVQSSAGGIRLDTLFLDEGFGSLDEESLELAIRVLSGLTEGDRLVGIISHVGALKDRIDRQVVVRKAHTGGSTVELIV